MGGLKTCYVPISPLVRLTDPGMVDPCTFMVDPSVAFSARKQGIGYSVRLRKLFLATHPEHPNSEFSFILMTKSDLEDIGGLKTCSAASSLLDGSTDPGMVDPCAFMVDPSGAIPADDPTKFMDLVPLVDALILSNPRPILQLDDF
ncbi:hypothetical protein Tco_0709289 [Tanacetum coccineum]